MTLKCKNNYAWVKTMWNVFFINPLGIVEPTLDEAKTDPSQEYRRFQLQLITQAYKDIKNTIFNLVITPVATEQRF